MKNSTLLAALCAAPLLAALTAPTAEAGLPTCQGQEATHVGTENEPLFGTAGDDVLVTNDAAEVRARGGDDLICVTGGKGQLIVAGAGDDTISAPGPGHGLWTDLGAGSDTYRGGPRHESVHLGVGERADHDRVSTRGGRDFLTAKFDGRRRTIGHRGTVTAHLGEGADAASHGPHGGGFRVYAGAGRDDVDYISRGRVMLSLRDGRLLDDLAHQGTVTGFENAMVFAGRAHIVGNRAPNRIRSIACRTTASGGQGADVIVGPRGTAPCQGSTMTFHGDGGNDRLVGWIGADRLYGGPGFDRADGGRGRDVCRAERKAYCEA